MGLLSADTWTWVGIYLRNLILNWLVLVPLLAAVLAIPKMGVPLVQLDDVVALRWGFLWIGLALLVGPLPISAPICPARKMALSAAWSPAGCGGAGTRPDFSSAAGHRCW